MPWIDWAFEAEIAAQAPGRLTPRDSSHRVLRGSRCARHTPFIFRKGPTMAPKVLVSDKLSETAVQIFRDRGIEVDFDPSIGKDKDKLLEVIGKYDGLAIRSATKVTAKVLERGDQPQGHRPRRHRRRQRRHPRRLQEGRDRDEHALRQLDHHRRACHRDDVRRRPPDPEANASHPCRQVGEVAVHGRRADRQDAGRDRRRQHRLDRLRPRARACR